MKKTIWAISVIGSALLAAGAVAQETGGAAGRGTATPGPTPLQLANPDYHPPAKRVPPSVGFLNQIKPSGTTPRLANGKPDLSGMWNGRFITPGGPSHRRGNLAAEADQAAIQRASWWDKPIYKPELWDKVRATDFSKVDVDPVFTCGPGGIPRDMHNPSIVENENQIWIMTREAKTRVAPLDNRPRNPDDEDQTTTMGIPIGHWDGDTLVLESTGFDDKTWFGWPGFFHSDRMSLTERLTRNGDILYYQYTLTDPVALAEPYTSVTYAFRLNPNAKAVPIEPLECRPLQLDNQIVDQYFRG